MKQLQVLDHGYVELVECWGSEERIIEAARMSTNKGFEGWEKDEKLLKYLYTHKHLTPFEMAGAIFEIKAPIFVFREWHRHRTQSYNEMSARYIPLPNENYCPSLERIKQGVIKAQNNRQAQGTVELASDYFFHYWLRQLEELYARAQTVYERGIALGVPKELARLPVPVARYSRMRVSTNLRNWLQFLELRDTAHAPGAQWEIQQYADVVGKQLEIYFPRTIALFKPQTVEG